MRPAKFVWHIGASVAAICLLASAAISGRPAKVTKGPLLRIEEEGGGELEADGPQEAYEWRQLAWRDGEGRIDPDGLNRATAQRKALVARTDIKAFGDADDLSWTNLGPTRIAGRGRSISIDPTNGNRILEGSVGGGIWKTTDGGVSFSPVNDLMPNLAIGCLARDPRFPNTVYAGTGEGFFNSDRIRGNGLYKSTDGGDSWTQQTATANFFAINRIAVSPTDSNVVLIAATGGLFRSTDGGATFTPTKGTVNANGTYIAFNPQDATKAVAAVMDSVNGTAYTAYYSEDGGVTWTASTGLGSVAGFTSRLELAYAPSNPSIVYSTNAGDNRVWKSVDGGKSYASVSANTLDLTSQGWYDNCIAVSPTDPNFVVVGATTVWRSTNGGTNFARMGDGYNGSGVQPHPDVHALVFDPGYNGTTNKKFYVYTDGGTYRTLDATTASTTSGWTKFDKAITVQLYGVAGDEPTGILVGGAQDNGTQRVTGLDGGEMVVGGDGGYCAMDPTNANVQYGEYVRLQIYRTDNNWGGASWIYNGISDAGGGNANFIAPFTLDPNDSNLLWAGGARLWLSKNAKSGAPSWASVRPAGSNLISAIGVAPGNSNIVAVGQNDGVVSLTKNALAATPTWTNLVNTTGGTNQFNRYVNRVLIDPANSNVIYVALGGFTPNNLWKTTDGGTTWTSITGNLPQAPIRGFARDPLNPLSLFAGTEVGVFWSRDGGVTWSTTNVAPANVSVDELTWANNGRTLLAATHGRGFWTAKIQTLALSVNPSTILSGEQTTGTVTLAFPASAAGRVVTLTSASPLLTVPASVTVPAGATSVTFTATAGVVTAARTVVVTAKSGQLLGTASVKINPGGLMSLSVAPTSVVGGSATSVTGTVTLDGPAPTGGASIALSSSNAAASVQTTVVIPAGSTSATFPISTSVVASNTVANILAGRGQKTFSQPLTVLPPTITAFTLAPTSVYGGATVTGSVTVDAVAPSGGLPIALVDDSNRATTPSNVVIPEGASTGTFTITTGGVATITTVKVTATLGTTIKSSTFKINPSLLSSVSYAPSSVTGGANATGTAKLTGFAPPGGAVVNLSVNSSVVTIPATVTIPEGVASMTFVAKTTAVSSDVVTTTTATLGAVTKTAALTVKAPILTSLGFVPTSGIGGYTTTGKVTISGAAPAAGTTIALSSNSTAVPVPATVVVPAGATSVTFTSVTLPVSADVTATVTATLGTSSKTATVKVLAPVVYSLKVSPTSVTGGATSTGTVTITGAAPAGGLSVALTSSSASATVPASVVVPAGGKVATFSIATNPVAAQTAVTITATRGVAKTAILTINTAVPQSVAFAPSSVIGGISTTGTVTLTGLAAPGGAVVNLSSGSSSVVVPSTVTVAAGTKTATFTATTSPVASTVTVPVTATRAGVSKVGNVSVKAPAVVGLSVSPASVQGSAATVVTLTVTLSGVAPAGGITVALTSSSPLATVPATVTVAGGSTTATVTVGHSAAAANTAVTLGASANGGSRTCTLTVKP